MALFDLANSVRVGNPVEEIAMFLCRSRREVREEIAEIRRARPAHRGGGSNALPKEPDPDALPA